MNPKRLTLVSILSLFVSATSLFGNGGAWQTGVPVTGNAAATDAKKSTNVTIEDEKLTIDLHQEFAAVEVHYRMKNTGGKVDQDFFFPVERWAESEDEAGNTLTDLEEYSITADGAELKFDTVDAKGEKPKAEKDAAGWGDFQPGTRLWKKSVIPFGDGVTREIVIRYRSPYAANQSSVSDDGHSTDSYFRYSLSPAATWKGPIGKGKITVNYLHPRPEEIVITKPKDRFKKINDTQYAWEFQNLKPTLADDMKIITHPAIDTYPAGGEYSAGYEDQKFRSEYVVVQKNRYFVQHSDYDAAASSTRNPDPAPSPSPTPTASPSESSSESAAETEADRSYDVNKIKGLSWGHPWAEGVDGDGIGESITLTVHHPLPLDAIMIMPGFKSDDKTLWTKNNRVAELEITLNGEHTFTVAIPDEQFSDLYPIPVRGYTKPVNAVKLVIKKVHPGTGSHDTCISQVQLRGKLSQKPKIQGAR